MRVPRGTAVEVVVSSGRPKPGPPPTTGIPTVTEAGSTPAQTAPPPKTRVPDVRGLSLVAGVGRLLAADLRVDVHYVGVPGRVGSIVRQTPGAGTTSAGDRVSITVSAGRKPTFLSVPDVLTDKLGVAERALRRAGFVPRVFLIRGPAIQRSLVLDVEPAGERAAPKGAQIVLLVGGGPRA